MFPRIGKGGFLIGGQGGEGALIVNGETEAYYSSAAVSYGLQAGIQKFGYALILMSDADLEHVRTTKGWELGSGPSIVFVDAGAAKTLSTRTISSGVYAFTFGQKGLMAGVVMEASKSSSSRIGSGVPS